MLVKVEQGAVERMLERTRKFGAVLNPSDRARKDQSHRRLRLRINEWRKRIQAIKEADPSGELSRGEARVDPEVYLAMTLEETAKYNLSELEMEQHLDGELHLEERRQESAKTLDNWKAANRTSGSTNRKRRREK